MRFALSLYCAAVLGFAATYSAAAQTAPALPVVAVPAAVATLAASEPVAPLADAASSSSLPDAPSAAADTLADGQAGVGGAPSSGPIARKYTTTILPGQGALPLSGKDKVAFAFRDAVSPFSLAAILISATYSQGIDSQPHYGSDDWGKPYAQRIGAAAARSTVQTLATEAIFDPLFHDDPRYYVLGRNHNFFGRVVYAATRVVVTHGDNGHNRLNAPLLLGYAVAAGTNFAYYPQRDRNFGDAATGYAGSLGGAVLGMEVNEFIGDALHLVHLRK